MKTEWQAAWHAYRRDRWAAGEGIIAADDMGPIPKGRLGAAIRQATDRRDPEASIKLWLFILAHSGPRARRYAILLPARTGF